MSTRSPSTGNPLRFTSRTQHMTALRLFFCPIRLVLIMTSMIRPCKAGGSRKFGRPLKTIVIQQHLENYRNLPIQLPIVVISFTLSFSASQWDYFSNSFSGCTWLFSLPASVFSYRSKTWSLDSKYQSVDCSRLSGTNTLLNLFSRKQQPLPS